MRSIERLLNQTEIDLQRYLYNEEKLIFSFYSIFNLNEDFDYEISDKDVEDYRNSIKDFNISLRFEVEDEYIMDEEIVTILEEIRKHHKEDYLAGVRELEWYNERINKTEKKIEELRSLIELQKEWRIFNLLPFCLYQIIVRLFRW